MLLKKGPLTKEAIRFLITGSINTVFTYLIYYTTVERLGYIKAFSLAFVIGVIFSYIFYCIFVFKSSLSVARFFQYPLLYVAQYIAGLVILTILIKIVGLDVAVAPVINVVILMPITFFLNKWFFLKE